MRRFLKEVERNNNNNNKNFAVRRRQELNAFGKLPERAYTALPQSKRTL